MRMEMRAKETRERIIIDTQLGYPLVFVDYYGYDRCYEPFFAQAKREMLDKIGSGDGPVDWDKETATVQEALVIGRWIEKGYLCYPASTKDLVDQDFGCGPKYVDIYEVISTFDNLKAMVWWTRCKSLRQEIMDFLFKARKDGKLESVEDAKPAEAASKMTLEEAVRRLGNPKLSCQEGRVYYRVGFAAKAYDQMINLWIRKSGLPDDEIFELVGQPLAYGHVLLTLPPEMREYEELYWIILGSDIPPGSMRELMDVQAALNKITGK